MSNRDNGHAYAGNNIETVGSGILFWVRSDAIRGIEPQLTAVEHSVVSSLGQVLGLG
jgi:hypothetical protein